MDGSNLGNYLKSNQEASRTELVSPLLRTLYSCRLSVSVSVIANRPGFAEDARARDRSRKYQDCSFVPLVPVLSMHSRSIRLISSSVLTGAPASVVWGRHALNHLHQLSTSTDSFTARLQKWPIHNAGASLTVVFQRRAISMGSVSSFGK